MKDNIIYKAHNIINGLVYIGATTNSLKSRRLDHIERANRREENKFHEAISTYGADAFEWEQIDTANTVNELAQKEKEHIIKYDCKENGYNSDAGGGIQKTIYQYSIEDGSLIKRFDSLESAGNSVNANKKQISRVCLSVNMFYSGYYWSYEYREPFTPSRDKRRKQVVQFSLEGIKIAEYSSVAEASYITGLNKSSIAKVCRGEQEKSGGYKWIYS